MNAFPFLHGVFFLINPVYALVFRAEIEPWFALGNAFPLLAPEAPTTRRPVRQAGEMAEWLKAAVC
jgi:hypothetical protein